MKMKHIKLFNEGYEMDLDRGDIGEEHAKAAISLMFDMSNGIDAAITENSLQKALDKICDDFGIEKDGDDRKEIIISSVKSLANEIAGQAERLK